MKLKNFLLTFALLLSSQLVHAENTPAEIQKFVYSWFAGFDRNAPEDFFQERLASKDLKMVFPEVSIYNRNDFRAWYSNIQNTIAKASHEIKSVQVLTSAAEDLIVEVHVLWKAKTFAGTDQSFAAKQIWYLVREQGALKIQKYLVSEDKPTPIKTEEYPRSCLCPGTPGGAPGPNLVPAISTVVYGGPGYYRYETRTCPTGCTPQ